MTGGILDLSKGPLPSDLLAEICIVGSGSAGATAAWDLAKAGREVVVLEEGGDFTGLALTQRDGAMYDQLYMERGGRSTSDLSISVMQGRVLGGGGVINVCDVVPISDPVLRHWQSRFGLNDFAPEALEPYRQRALEDLSANLPEEKEQNRNNQILRQGTEALGWAGSTMLHNRVGCVGIGSCLVGCPLDKKRNPRFVAVPGAVDAGARFLLRARAKKILNAGSDTKTVEVAVLDSKGYHETGSFHVRAKAVVLAANAIASTELLLRSGIGNEHVGRHVSLQPQLPVTAYFPDEEVRFFRGIPQSYAVTEFEEHENPEHGWWGFRIEAIGGTPGIVASLVPLVGEEGKEQMRHYSRFAASLGLLPDEPVGRIEVERSGRLRVHYTLTEEWKGRARKLAKAAARIYLAAGAREVLFPVIPPLIVHSERELDLLDSMTLQATSAPLLSAHQQGGVRMSPSPAHGAADPQSQVYGTRGVYVFDSGGYPSSASSHTMTPIIALAHYFSDQLQRRLS